MPTLPYRDKEKRLIDARSPIFSEIMTNPIALAERLLVQKPHEHMKIVAFHLEGFPSEKWFLVDFRDRNQEIPKYNLKKVKRLGRLTSNINRFSMDSFEKALMELDFSDCEKSSGIRK